MAGLHGVAQGLEADALRQLARASAVVLGRAAPESAMASAAAGGMRATSSLLQAIGVGGGAAMAASEARRLLSRRLLIRKVTVAAATGAWRLPLPHHLVTIAISIAAERLLRLAVLPHVMPRLPEPFVARAVGIIDDVGRRLAPSPAADPVLPVLPPEDVSPPEGWFVNALSAVMRCCLTAILLWVLAVRYPEWRRWAWRRGGRDWPTLPIRPVAHPWGAAGKPPAPRPQTTTAGPDAPDDGEKTNGPSDVTAISRPEEVETMRTMMTPGAPRNPVAVPLRWRCRAA